MNRQNTNPHPNILMMAAGTGGHVFPALAVAEELKKRGATIHWLGTPKGMENELVASHGYKFHAIDMMGLRGKGITRLIKLPFTLSHAILQAKKIILENNIDIAVGFGGYVTAPGGLAAKILGKPLIIHEQNAIAGMSNRYLSKIASKVLQAFPNAFKNNTTKIITVGNPVRKAITELGQPSNRFDPNDLSPLKVLIVGGSLGAQVLNDVVPLALQLMDKSVEVQHQCGKNNYEYTQEKYQKVNSDLHSYKIKSFIDDMADAYAWADVIICRAGALTVTEIQNVGLPAIFVPLPHAVDDHQTANAKYLDDIDAAFLLPQSQLTPESLKEKLSNLNRKICLEMATRGISQANPDSSNTVATIIWEYV